MRSDFFNKLISILSPPRFQGRKHNSENVQRTLHTTGNGNGVVCVCVCVFIKLHITAQSGPAIYSFYATACNPPGGYLS